MNTAKFRTRNEGAALVLTLFLVALLVVMVIGYMEVARSDRTHSHQNLQRVRAESAAREGIERAVGTLRREILNPLRYAGETDAHYKARQRNWVSQPGQLIVPLEPVDLATNISVDQKQLRRKVALSSGAPTAGVTYTKPILEPAELNLQLLTQQSPAEYLITSQGGGAANTAPSMKLRWIYIREGADGKPVYDTDENPDLTNVDEPIVGRFAWWVDDESTKVNFNLAWKKAGSTGIPENTNSASHPSKIGLQALRDLSGSYLTEAMADKLHEWTTQTPGRYFNSFADARQLDKILPGISRFLRDNQFEVTHYNHDPDLTFFGEERILLTTNPDLVPKNPDGTFARRFINILRDDLPAGVTPDPGLLHHIAGGQKDWVYGAGAPVPNKFDAAVTMIIDYLTRENWPMAPGLSFRNKYFPGSSATDVRLGQIAANIIDYVRAKESQQSVVPPLRFTRSGGAYTLDQEKVYQVNTTLQGIGRVPLITEVGAWIAAESQSATRKEYPFTFRAELYLPENYSIPEGIDLAPEAGDERWYIGFDETSGGKYKWRTPNGNLIQPMQQKTNISYLVRIIKDEITGGSGPNGTILMPGNHVVITKEFISEYSWADRPQVQARVSLQKGTDEVSFRLNNPERFPVVCIFPQSTSTSDPLLINLSDPANGGTKDEMLSLQTDDPRCGVHKSDWQGPHPNTFGEKNSTNRIGLPPNIDAALPQQDTDANGNLSDHSLYMPPPKGVGSNGPDGDNGRVVSVGELGYINTGANAINGSISWRSLRLQPNRYTDTNTLPDWLLADLFSVPNAPSNATDHLTNPHGTSVGGRVNINSRVEPFPTLHRKRGLVGVLLGAKGVDTVAKAEEIASNIHSFTLAPTKNGSYGKAYGYPWGNAEPNVFDTPGEVCEIAGVADDGEAGEDRVREILSNITTRGGVFGIYTVGQSLKQLRSGGLEIVAEKRFHAVVECFKNTFGTATEADDQMEFQTIYMRQLNP